MRFEPWRTSKCRRGLDLAAESGLEVDLVENALSGGRAEVVLRSGKAFSLLIDFLRFLT